MVSTFDSLSLPPADMTLTVAIWMGVLASLHTCAVVRLPILATYVAGMGTSRKHAALLAGLLALGLVGGTCLLGLAATPAADGVHETLRVNKYSFWVLGSCLVVTGVLVCGLVPERWRCVGRWLARANVPGALLLGFVLGLLLMPACPTCRAQLLAIMEAASKGLSVSGPVLLVGFAVAQGLVALGVGMMVALLKPILVSRLRTRMCSLEQRVQLLAGNVLVVLGVYFVIVG
jgi:hypothetical protein